MTPPTSTLSASAEPAALRAGLEESRPRRTSRSWRRPAEEWERLTPRGFYARRLRGPFLGLALVPLLPLALGAALPIALVNLLLHRSPRRILFAQTRVGWRGELFVLYKFRTLLDRPGDDGSRATRFGRFLRNTHLDELPQLWNVLRGEMALVGPRPEMLATERWAAEHCPGFSERLCLKPGLTGYAQITQGYTDGGDLAAYLEKRARNWRYREELCLALDCAILLRTAAWMLRARGWR